MRPLCGITGRSAREKSRAAGHEVAGVSSPPFATSRATTGEALPDRLRAAAEAAGVPWRASRGLRAETLPAGVDLIIAAHSHDFIGRATRLRAEFGAVGFHPSLLPLHRGRDAIRWAVHMRERVTGGSMYWLTDTTDGGPIAAQAHAFIRPSDTPEELWRRELFPLGLRLVARVLADLGRGVMVAVPQEEALATWEPSWSRAPLHRPELPMLGDGRATSVEIARELSELHPGG